MEIEIKKSFSTHNCLVFLRIHVFSIYLSISISLLKLCTYIYIYICVSVCVKKQMNTYIYCFPSIFILFSCSFAIPLSVLSIKQINETRILKTLLLFYYYTPQEGRKPTTIQINSKWLIFLYQSYYFIFTAGARCCISNYYNIRGHVNVSSTTHTHTHTHMHRHSQTQRQTQRQTERLTDRERDGHRYNRDREKTKKKKKHSYFSLSFVCCLFFVVFFHLHW